MTRPSFSPEEVQEQVEREYVSLAYRENLARIGANHFWPECPWCREATPNSSQRSTLTDEGYAHPACADTMGLYASEDWGPRTHGIKMLWHYPHWREE
jgi:hypothetical protein